WLVDLFAREAVSVDLLRIAVGQRALQLLTCVEQPTHDRAFRDANGPSHFFVTQALDLTQDDDGAVVAWKVVGRGLEASSDLAPANDVGRVAPVRLAERGEVGVGVVFGGEPPPVEIDRLPAGLALEVDAEVRDDPVEPREEARAPLKVGQALVRTQERVLNDPARVVFVANEGGSEGHGWRRHRLVGLVGRLVRRRVLLFLSALRVGLGAHATTVAVSRGMSRLRDARAARL